MPIMKQSFEKLYDTRDYLQTQFNTYAPQPIKIAVRNIRYNVGTLVKKGRKIWKKHLWPLLEPFLGVPKGTAAQKRKDAQESRRRREAAAASSAGGTKKRRKNKDFRDNMDDEM